MAEMDKTEYIVAPTQRTPNRPGHRGTTVLTTEPTPEERLARLAAECAFRGQRTPLRTLEQVHREVARVYRAMKTKAIETQEGTRLTYVLDCLGKITESVGLERRLDRLEQQQAKLLPDALRRDAAGE